MSVNFCTSTLVFSILSAASAGLCVSVYMCFYVWLQFVIIPALLQEDSEKYTSSRGPARGFITAEVRKEGESRSEGEHALGGIEKRKDVERDKGLKTWRRQKE